jgi:hypothetical protein
VDENLAMRAKHTHLPVLIAALAALTFACVSVDNSRSGGGTSGGQSGQQKNDSGFTVSETTVPSTPATDGATSTDGFTVDVTAVPDK